MVVGVAVVVCDDEAVTEELDEAVMEGLIELDTLGLLVVVWVTEVLGDFVFVAVCVCVWLALGLAEADAEAELVGDDDCVFVRDGELDDDTLDDIVLLDEAVMEGLIVFDTLGLIDDVCVVLEYVVIDGLDEVVIEELIVDVCEGLLEVV